MVERLTNWKKLIIEILLVILLFLLERVWRVFKLKRPFNYHNRKLWTIVFWLMALINLGGYWIAYPLIGWMVIAIGLIIVQAVGNHEFVYAIYWPKFWSWSFYYSALVFAITLFLHHLPLI